MFSVRQINRSELPTLLEFAERTFRIAFQHLNEPGMFETYCRTVFTAGQFERQFLDPSAQFWWGLVDNRFAAYTKLNLAAPPPDMAGASGIQVERLYVDPAFQRMGIGEKMLQHAQQIAQSIGVQWVWLSTWKDTPDSLRFYQRCGFEVYGEEIFWLGEEPQEDWLMRKPVS